MAKARKHVVDLARLSAAMERARLSLRRFRAERREMVRQFVGNHWSEEGAIERVPVNLISLYVQVVGRSLIAKDPRFLFSTFDLKQKAVVKAEMAWINKQVQKIRLQNTLQRVVTDALFSLGILKTGIATPAQASQLAFNLPAGEPYAERVDLDDFVFDVHARDFSEVSFIGHRCRVPLDAVRDSTLYRPARKDLVASRDDPFNKQGDERIGVLGRSYYDANAEEFIEHVDLWEIYVPSMKLVLTLSDEGGTTDEDDGGLVLLREQEWIGPDCGPYHILGYQVVPGSAMPKGPVQDLMDLHLFVNQTYRKLMRQAERQKEMTFVQGGATEDGQRVMNANDGDIPKVDNPDKIKQVIMGGPNQSNFLFAQHAWELFSKQAGNLEMMGGLSPQSKTATQDKMLMMNASGQVSSMQQDTYNFTEAVGRSLCWLYHHHPQLQMRDVHRPDPGLDSVETVREVGPEQRKQVKYADLDIRIDVYSMQQQTPQTRIQGITQVLATLQPLMPLAAQQGVLPDLAALIRIFAEFLDLPELQEIMQTQEPPDQGGQEQPGMSMPAPAETTRNYVRRSLGADSQQSQTAQLANTLAKGMGQNGQMPVNQNGVA